MNVLENEKIGSWGEVLRFITQPIHYAKAKEYIGEDGSTLTDDQVAEIISYITEVGIGGCFQGANGAAKIANALAANNLIAKFYKEEDDTESI